MFRLYVVIGLFSAFMLADAHAESTDQMKTANLISTTCAAGLAGTQRQCIDERIMQIRSDVSRKILLNACGRMQEGHDLADMTWIGNECYLNGMHYLAQFREPDTSTTLPESYHLGLLVSTCSGLDAGLSCAGGNDEQQCFTRGIGATAYAEARKLADDCAYQEKYKSNADCQCSQKSFSNRMTELQGSRNPSSIFRQHVY